MAFFEWSDKIRLGIDPMDKGHKDIIGLINRLYESNGATPDRAQLSSLFEELFEVTRRHFADEEAFMESIRYQDFEVHRRIHNDLLLRLAMHLNNYKASSEDRLPNDLFTFLMKWLTVHILGNDKRYALAAK